MQQLVQGDTAGRQNTKPYQVLKSLESQGSGFQFQLFHLHTMWPGQVTVSLSLVSSSACEMMYPIKSRLAVNNGDLKPQWLRQDRSLFPFHIKAQRWPFLLRDRFVVQPCMASLPSVVLRSKRAAQALAIMFSLHPAGKKKGGKKGQGAHAS